MHKRIYIIVYCEQCLQVLVVAHLTQNHTEAVSGFRSFAFHAIKMVYTFYVVSIRFAVCFNTVEFCNIENFIAVIPD